MKTLSRTLIVILITFLANQMFAQNGKCIEGDCQNGMGSLVWEGIGRYKGNFKDSKKSGYGALYWLDRSQYIGEWLNDQRHGAGVYRFPDLTTISGIWKNGQLVEEDKKDAAPPSRSIADLTGPEFVITEPELSSDLKIITKKRKFTLRGYVADPASVMGLWVNDQKATLKRQGKKHTEFEVEIEMGLNTDQIIVEAVDRKFNKSKEVYPFQLSNKPTPDTDDFTKLKRTALVIGNSQYTIAPLRNTVNDAKAISKKLKDLGFKVVQYTNLDQQGMENAINDFGKLIDKRGGVALFYFAGHGVQADGANYLIPVKSNIQSEKDIKYKAVKLGYMLDEFKGQNNGMNIIILDACRNNPFSRYRGTSNGLTPTTVSPSGTFIAYSTSPGSVAYDGEGANGLYTQELVQQISVKGQTIEQVFKKVRSNVRQRSAGAQIPWEISSIEGDFYFAPE